MAIQRLTAAYRSRSRPSSTPGAKASTVCPSYLDGDRRLASHESLRVLAQGPNSRARFHESPGDTRSHLLAEVLRWHDCAVFKVRARRAPRTEALGLSKLNSMAPREARDPGPVDIRNRLELAPRGMRGGPLPALHVLELPRKEVIQPHLPVRLPCYDFTPVTSPTFDGSLPKG